MQSKKNKGNCKKSDSGITLVALIISVIVIVILAGISIGAISGKNGIINQAGEAKNLTEEAEDKENLQMEYMSTLGKDKDGNVTYDEYFEALEQQGIATKQEDGKYYASTNGRTYEVKIDDNGGLDVVYNKKGEISTPRITKFEALGKTESTIQVSVEAARAEDCTYKYYISKDKDNFGDPVWSGPDTKYTFTGLDGNVKYYIKVVAETKNGSSSKIIEEEITKLPDAEEVITYNTTWKNGKAIVSFNTQSGYQIEISYDNKTYKPGKITSGLQNGDKVYARITDGKVNGKEMEVIITDKTAPVVKLAIQDSTSKTIKVKAESEDTESGISGQKYSFYISDSLSGIENATVYGTSENGEYTFDNLNQNTTYYIKAEIEDNAGNKGKSENLVSATKLIPSAEQAISRNIKWNSEKQAIISLSTNENYEIKYSTDRVNWQKYSEEITVNNNSKIYIVLTDGKNNGQDYEISIQDNEGPNVKITQNEITSSSIKITVNAEDGASGMPKTPIYNYYIKKNGDSEYKKVATNLTSNTYSYTGLSAKTTYNIKVTSSDIIGNEGIGTANYTTTELKYKNGDITFENLSWNEKKATITVKNNTSYNMQYKIVPKGEEIVLAEGMTETSEKTINVGELKNNYTVVARLYDGTNSSAEYATYQVKDTTVPTIQVTGNPETWQKDDVTLVINAKDNESGLSDYCYSFNGGTTWQKENTKTYSENTDGIIIKVKDEAGNIATNPAINISKIDKTGPEITTQTNTTSNSITIKIANITDSGAGVGTAPEISYKISKTEQGLESAKAETEIFSDANNTKIYNELTQNTTYYVQIQAEDNLGNITKKILTLATGSLNASSDSLKIADVTWKDGKASSTITNSSEYKMQYQIVSSGEKYNENKNWILTNEKTINLTNLNNGDTIYTRLTDETNYSGVVSKKVEDKIAPIVNVAGNPDNWTNKDVTLTITATDNETGLAEKPYSFDGGTTWQAENTKQYQENTSGIIIKVKDKARKYCNI